MVARQLSHADVLAMMKPVGSIVRSDVLRLPGLCFHYAWDHDLSWADHLKPCVYAWVEAAGADRAIIYIGKAGGGLQPRCDQHERGFRSERGSGPGHAAAIRRALGAGHALEVHVMWPEPVEFRGERIASHSSVEDWLIARTHPRPARNRNG